MPGRHIRIELLLGRPVVDPEGRRVGRIEEFDAERHGEHTVITHVVLGVGGLLERLAAPLFGKWLSRLLGRRHVEPRRIPWHALDLSDARHPRLRTRLHDA